MNILDSIFSIKNKGIHKIVTIFGIKIKTIFAEAYVNSQNHYEQKLNELKEKIKTTKLNVIFLSNEVSKWSYDSLYRKFADSEYFYPLIVIYPLSRLTKEEINKELKEHYNFYANKGYNVKYGYSNNESIPIKFFNPDIVFYPQPNYEITEENHPYNVSETALTMYCPYGIQTFEYKNNYLQKFHKFLFTYFCENELNIKRYESYKKDNSKNCVSVGYPKMDEFLENHVINYSKYWKNPDKFKIIYAPHHSFGKDATTNIGTFLENGKYILNLAKKYSDITTWIFKPHPRLKYTLKQSKLMSEAEIEEYWKEWEELGNIYELGDYIDIFKSSDLMITDCSSFLIEYLPSMHPLIRLVKKKSIAVNDFCKKCISQYYFANDNIELQNIFENLVLNNNDYKKEKRKELVKDIVDKNQPSADKIYDYILKILEIECINNEKNIN